MSIKLTIAWFRRLSKWLNDGQVFVLFVLVLVNAFLYAFTVEYSEGSIRITGYCLQLLGMMFAIRGILKIRLHFNHPSITSLMLAWMNKFPKWINNEVTELRGTGYVTESVRARIEVWAADDKNQSSEDRINAIVHNLERVKEELSNNHSEINNLNKKHELLCNKQSNDIKAITEKISSDLELLHTSDVLASLAGLVWLIIGITLSTLSNEIYAFFY